MAGYVKLDEAGLRQMFESPQGPLGKYLTKVAVRIDREAKQSMKGGSGRTYRRGKVTHRASAPGQPPAVDTGRLRSSITHELGAKGPVLVARVGTNVTYAKHLELGTSKMRPRPFLRPALAKVRGMQP
ncbi:MAG: HK97 gp10 family phage protein [Actinomycetota bacterium]|nr:MAG: HK97 gp10 family phage protein [Actinomycetota bacterium]